jgi:hypothetical protein
MRRTLAALSFAAVFGVVGCHGAGAVPVNAAAMKEAATAASAVQEAFYMRRTRYGIRKCYHEFVVGPYVCHTFRRWW